MNKGKIWEMYKYSGSNEPTATVVADKTRYRNNGSMVDAKPDWVKTDKGLWVLDFNGADAVVDVGNVNRYCRSAVLWIYPDDNTSRSLMDLDGGTHSIELDVSGDCTATGWSTPTVYIGGSSADPAVTQSAWNHIAVTTATPFLVSDFDIGKEASFFDGKIANVTLYGIELPVEIILNIIENEKRWFGIG